MARAGGKDRGIVEKPKGSGKWWVRLWIQGREQRFRCDNKTQAKNLYDRLKVEQREGRLFPERYRAKHQLTVKQWISRCLEGSTNRDGKHEKQRAEYWADLWDPGHFQGSRLKTFVSSRRRWSAAVIFSRRRSIDTSRRSVAS